MAGMILIAISCIRYMHPTSTRGYNAIESTETLMESKKWLSLSCDTASKVASVMLSAILIGCNGDGGMTGTPSTSESSSSGASCSDYSSQAAAQSAHNSGIKGLDADSDGIACENLK